MKRMTVILVAGLLIAADAKKADPVKDELKKLEGAWTLESMTRDGAAMGPKDGVLEFSGDKLTLTSKADAKEQKATVKIDPSKNPKTIDITVEEKKEGGPGAGIYELKGDTLKMCFAGPGEDRPTEFNDKGKVLITFKRKK